MGLTGRACALAMFAFDGMIRRQLKAMIGEAGDANVSVSNGCVLIEDVHFDEAALEELIWPSTDPSLPPMKLGTLHVQKLAVSIPWGNFTKGFVEVELDGLSVNLARRPAAEATVQVLRSRKEACVAELMMGLVSTVSSMAGKSAKKKKEAADSAKEGEQSSGGPLSFLGAGVQTMVLGLVRKVLETFRPIIRISNVHIRYEDLAADAAARLALGVTVGKLMLQHPDSPYSEIDEDPNMMPVKDVVDLEVAISGVGAYLHSGSMGATSVIGGGPEAQAIAKRKARDAPALTGSAAKRAAATNGGEDDRTVEAMRRILVGLLRGDEPEGAHQWILRPIAVSGKVHVNVGIFIGAPTRFDWPHMVVADLTVAPIAVAVSTEQACALVVAGSELMLMPARYMYKMLRPIQWHPRAVLRAAINAVLGTLVEVSGATRLRNAIRDRMQYQRTLVDAMHKMRMRDGLGAAREPIQLEDMTHVTDSKGTIQLNQLVDQSPASSATTSKSSRFAKRSKSGGSTAETLTASAPAATEQQKAIDSLLEVDALTPPMQIALWRLVAWAQAKSEAERAKLEGKASRRSLLTSALLGRVKSGLPSGDAILAASSALADVGGDGEVGEDDGDDPLAEAPLSFEMAVVNLRIEEVSVKLLIDDSLHEIGKPMGAGMRSMPQIELAASAAAAAAEPGAKTVTTVTTNSNLDGSITTTTSVTTFKKPVTDRPLTTVLGLSLTPIVVRARVAPKTATGVRLAVGEILLEHQIGRGADETQPLLRFHGNKLIPDTSPLLGPPKPVVEVPRPVSKGLTGFLTGTPKKPPPLKLPPGGTPATTDKAAAGEGEESGEESTPLPPALHAVISLPPEQPPGEPPRLDSLHADLTIHRGEGRLAPHQLRELFGAFFAPLDTSLDLLPGASISREAVGVLREMAEGMLTQPWWAILNALPAVLELVSGPDVMPALLSLNINAAITEGIAIHLMGEPKVGTSLGARHTVPLGRLQIPPIALALSPTETASERQVRLKIGLLDDIVLASHKVTPPLRPLSGPDAAVPIDASRLGAMLLSEQLQLENELRSAQELNRRMAAELAELQVNQDLMRAELYAHSYAPTPLRSPTSARMAASAPAAGASSAPSPSSPTTPAATERRAASAVASPSAPLSDRRLPPPVVLKAAPAASSTAPARGDGGKSSGKRGSKGLVRIFSRRASSPRQPTGGSPVEPSVQSI